jgi:hypothetical protein
VFDAKCFEHFDVDTFSVLSTVTPFEFGFVER